MFVLAMADLSLARGTLPRHWEPLAFREVLNEPLEFVELMLDFSDARKLGLLLPLDVPHVRRQIGHLRPKCDVASRFILLVSGSRMKAMGSRGQEHLERVLG